MNGKFELAFLGTNGSCAYNGGNRVKYGTNTLCVAVIAGDETLIFDSGTGICGFHELEGYGREHMRLFFSHYHIDHFSGLLFFSDLFNPQKRFDLYGPRDGDNDFYGVVDNFLSAPLHPIGIKGLGAKLDFHTIGAGDVIPLSDGVTVRTYALSHPGGSIGYRVEYAGKVFCYCTDVELAYHQNDPGLLEFTRNADLLVLDSFFDDGKVLPDWGHSSWRECAEWAKLSGAKNMALFHYGFAISDNDIDAMENNARKIFPNTFAAADRMRIEL